MDMVKTKGVIVKQTNFKDYDRIFTVVTERHGKIKALAPMVRRYKSSLNSSCQLLYFCNFCLSVGSRELYQIKSADIVESFYPLRNNIEKVSYASYFAELFSELSEENVPNQEALSLFLNTVHKLAYSDMPAQLLRIIFELKLLCLTGFSPVSECCVSCGSNEDIKAFDAALGGVLCDNCKENSQTKAAPLSPTAYRAMHYIITAPDKKLFSFSIPDEAQNELATALERFIQIHIEKKFKTLSFLKTMLS